jgi:hypothetical protein
VSLFDVGVELFVVGVEPVRYFRNERMHSLPIGFAGQCHPTTSDWDSTLSLRSEVVLPLDITAI